MNRRPIQEPSNQELIHFAVGLLVVGVLAVTIVYGCKGQNTSVKSAVTSTAPRTPVPGSKQIIKIPRFGCIYKTDFDRLYSYLASGDTQAARDFALAGIATGKTTLFRQGEEVIVEDISLLGGVKVRRLGQQMSYWTFEDAIQIRTRGVK